MEQNQLNFILESAILAPSADNRHQIRFEVSQNIIRIYHTRTEFPAKEGYKWVLALLSLGAVSENFTLAASRFNLRAEIKLFPDLHNSNLVMQISLHPDQAESDPLWEMIPLRHTCRRLRFHGPSMTRLEKNTLDDAIRPFSDCKLVWMDNPRLRKQVTHLMRLAETERFRNLLLHEELFSAIRFDVGWHSTCAEGLPPGALGIESVSRSSFSLLRHWSIARLANCFGMHHILGFRSSYLPCRLAPHLGIITVKKVDTHTIFNVGRAFQRLWLAVTQEGRVLQPMPASALYALPNAPTEGIPETLQKKLAGEWQKVLGDDLPVLLFRMGKANHLPIAAGRPPVSSFISPSA